jgi:hypothetical protein
MVKIKGKQIFKQLKADLIGKDSYRGVTLTYSWLANQMGHFSLGFIPTIVIFVLSVKYQLYQAVPAIEVALYVAFFWIAFETYNVVAPLLFKKQTKSKVVFISNGVKNEFKVPWFNVIFDTITDLMFFSVGCFCASLLLDFSHFNLYIVIGISILMSYPAYYWFLTKMYQDNARFPLQFRLNQFDKRISKESIKKVNDYINVTDDGNHILIFGSKGSGKSSLSVGIINEIAIQHKACLYFTALKLYSLMHSDLPNQIVDENVLWSWENTDYLIIDDINPCKPIEQDLINADTLWSLIDTPLRGKKNMNILKNKNVIWVLGEEKAGIDFKDNSWYKLLISLGVKTEKITELDLNQ